MSAIAFTTIEAARDRAGELPILCDLFSGAGGAAKGYKDAGFYVVGVDNRPQPRYAGDEFVLADAMTYPLDGFDAIHASPPCQGYSVMRNLPWLRDKEYPMLIEPMRERLIASGVPWVIENVMGAQRKAEMHAGWLCGMMFGLDFPRHRLFQTSFMWLQPSHPKHARFSIALPMGHATHRDIGRHRAPTGSWDRYKHSDPMGSVMGKAGLTTPRADRPGLTRVVDQVQRISMSGGLERNMRGKRTKGNGAQAPAANVGHAAGFALAKEAMGIDWMKREELTQAIPPVMTEYIGRQLISSMEVRS